MAQITPQKEKATNTTAGCDWSSLSLGSINKKNSALNKQKAKFDVSIWTKFEPKSFHYNLSQADPWFLEKRPLNFKIS